MGRSIKKSYGKVLINLIGFIPETVRAYFPVGMVVIGLAEFFGLLYIAYEAVSILKNMTLCGLPVKKIWQITRNVLSKYTDELPDSDEILEKNVRDTCERRQ